MGYRTDPLPDPQSTRCALATQLNPVCLASPAPMLLLFVVHSSSKLPPPAQPPPSWSSKNCLTIHSHTLSVRSQLAMAASYPAYAALCTSALLMHCTFRLRSGCCLTMCPCNTLQAGYMSFRQAAQSHCSCTLASCQDDSGGGACALGCIPPCLVVVLTRALPCRPQCW